jgi:hypothetical protein
MTLFLDVHLFYSYAWHVHPLVPLVMMGHSHFPWASKEASVVASMQQGSQSLQQNKKKAEASQ